LYVKGRCAGGVALHDGEGWRVAISVVVVREISIEVVVNNPGGGLTGDRWG
jgi:hypothetical protein